MLFVSIGFFGYVALHARILHSGQRLEQREVVRSATGFLEAVEIGRALNGNQLSISGESYQVSHYSQAVMRVTTLPHPNVELWSENFPPEFHQGLDQTYELSPFVMEKPYEYSWKTR